MSNKFLLKVISICAVILFGNAMNTTPVAARTRSQISGPNLLLDKTVSDLNGGTVQPGDVLEYTLTLFNNGDADATQDSPLGLDYVEDNFPPNTSYVPNSITGGDSRSVGSTWALWGVDTVPAGANVVMTFQVTIDNPLPLGVTTISNQAVFALKNENSGNSDDSNNSANDPAIISDPADPTVVTIGSPTALTMQSASVSSTPTSNYMWIGAMLALILMTATFMRSASWHQGTASYHIS